MKKNENYKTNAPDKHELISQEILRKKALLKVLERQNLVARIKLRHTIAKLRRYEKSLSYLIKDVL